MSAFTNRVSRLEAEAAKQARPSGGWSTYWAALRKIYGDHGDYSAEELLALDGIDPAPALQRAMEEAYGRRSDESQ